MCASFLWLVGPCKTKTLAAAQSMMSQQLGQSPRKRRDPVLSSNGENFIRIKRTMKSRSMPTNRTVPDVTCIRSREETGAPNKGVSVDKKVSERAPCYRQASGLSSERNASSATVQQRSVIVNNLLIVYLF